MVNFMNAFFVDIYFMGGNQLIFGFLINSYFKRTQLDTIWAKYEARGAYSAGAL